MESVPLTTDMTAAEVMKRWPRTVTIFIRNCMACVGCPIAQFETLREVAAIFNLNLDRFMHDLQEITDSKNEPRSVTGLDILNAVEIYSPQEKGS